MSETAIEYVQPHTYVSKINEDARAYIEASLSANTRKALKSDLKHFRNWGGDVPATPEIIIRYITEHASILKTSTLKRKIASLTKLHLMKNYPNPCADEMVKLTMKGISRIHGAPQKQAKPLLKEDIISIVTRMNDTSKAMRDKALLLIGFAGALRRSELVSLRAQDIEYVPQGLTITLLTSKTDKTNAGRVIGVPYARGKVCPVKALQDWSAVIPEHEYLFPSVGKGGAINTKPLSTRSIPNIVKRYAKAIGLNAQHYSGHSLRAGLATSAAMHGVASYKIRQQTGHKSDAMLSRYIRDGDLFTDNAAGLLF